jgi:hypothetical protein
MQRLGWALLMVMVVASSVVRADSLDYVCSVGDVGMSIHVDIEAKSVTEQVESGAIKGGAEYIEGEYGKVSYGGISALLPSMHQFVRITEDYIYFGGERQGKEDGAAINRRLSTLTLPNGKTGWCSLQSPAERN